MLNDSAADDLGDQDALEAELERELAAAEEEMETAAAPTPAAGKKKVSGGGAGQPPVKLNHPPAQNMAPIQRCCSSSAGQGEHACARR